jgi:hypothetical protein
MNLTRIIREAAVVFMRNYTLALPTVLSVFAVSFLSLVVVKTPEDSKGLIALALISMVISFFTHGVTVAMAREALETGSTSLTTGAYLAARFFTPFLSVSIAMAIIVSAGTMMFLLPGLVAAFLLLFVFPSIVVDGTGPVESLRASYGVVVSNLKDTVSLFLAILLGGLVFGIANLIVSSAGVVGQLLGVVISGFFGGYVSIVVLKSYMALKLEEITE